MLRLGKCRQPFDTLVRREAITMKQRNGYRRDYGRVSERTYAQLSLDPIPTAGRTHKKTPCRISAWVCKRKIRAGRKPSSVSLIAQGGEHLSGPSIARRHERPTRKSRTGRPYPLAGDASLCGLAPGGVFQAPPVARGSGGLLPHRFTLTPLAGRSSFLWHCPWGRPLSRFGTALPCGARTFLPPLPGSDHLTRSESVKTFC